MTVRVDRYVSSPTRMPFVGAASCIRDAVLTTSPATTPSPFAAVAESVTSASPVLTAIRTLRSRSESAAFIVSTALHIASAARTARSGSSPWDTGTPKTGITDELLDRSAERLDLAADPREVGRQDRAHILRVELLGPSREPDEVGKE